MHRQGKTLDEIAQANFDGTGWKPTRSGVLRKLQKLNLPGRYTTHALVIPWKIKPEHNSDPLRHMLQAESRWRQNDGQVSESDERLIDLLHDQLHGRGREFVVGYSAEDGFMLLPRRDDDEDIVRRPVEVPSETPPLLVDSELD